MIGNDVIDLKLAREKHKWQRPRFLEKLFTEAEREFILDAVDPELRVWLLWSMKESAYKIVARMEGRRFYAPKQFECEVKNKFLRKGYVPPTSLSVHDSQNTDREVGDTLGGRITYGKSTFTTQSIITSNFIHTIAYSSQNSTAQFTQKHFQTPRTNHRHQSHFTHQELLKCYAEQTGIHPKNLSIQKDQLNIPRLFQHKKALSTHISLSHHGNYGAFAINS